MGPSRLNKSFSGLSSTSVTVISYCRRYLCNTCLPVPTHEHFQINVYIHCRPEPGTTHQTIRDEKRYPKVGTDGNLSDSSKLLRTMCPE